MGWILPSRELCFVVPTRRTPLGEDIYGPLPQKTLHDLDTAGFTWRHKIAQVSGLTAVRIVVRDNATGRIGSITQALP